MLGAGHCSCIANAPRDPRRLSVRDPPPSVAASVAASLASTRASSSLRRSWSLDLAFFGVRSLFLIAAISAATAVRCSATSGSISGASSGAGVGFFRFVLNSSPQRNDESAQSGGADDPPSVESSASHSSSFRLKGKPSLDCAEQSAAIIDCGALTSGFGALLAAAAAAAILCDAPPHISLSELPCITVHVRLSAAAPLSSPALAAAAALLIVRVVGCCQPRSCPAPPPIARNTSATVCGVDHDMRNRR